MEAKLLLEDGSLFTGKAFGAVGRQAGEVVFQTGMTGYQELLTDPSYCGQMVVMTYPLIGNYGINPQDFEADRPACQALIVREAAAHPNHWRMKQDLHQYLQQQGVMGMEGVDTRRLTRRLRHVGTMRGVLLSGPDAERLNHFAESLAAKTKAWESMLSELGLQEAPRKVEQVSTQKFLYWKSQQPGTSAKRPLVVVMDFGVKHNMLRELNRRGCEVVVVPYTTTAEEINRLEPDGVLFSNGPGDPKQLPQSVLQAIRDLVESYPSLGICLGHQLIALAFGGDTEKMKFGHRGANQPVKDQESGKCWITSQNHGYTVIRESLAGSGFFVSLSSLNDDTVEGMRHEKLPVFTVQFHPEAAPGPYDTSFYFDRFLQHVQAKHKGEWKHAETH